MKKTFSLDELLQNKGCYKDQDIINLWDNRNVKFVKIETILKSKISIKDKRWFVYINCELTLDQKKQLCLLLAWEVLPIYENKYPNDYRVRDCLQGINDFNNNLISKNELLKKRQNSIDAAVAAVNDAAIYVANVANAAAYAVNDAYLAAAYAAHVAHVAYAVDVSYSQKLQDILINFIKIN